MRANRAPIRAPIPTSATPRAQGGRPPSINPVPCSTLEPIIAPNISLPEILSAAAAMPPPTDAAISSVSSSGEAIAPAAGGGDEGAYPVSASTAAALR